MMNQKVLVVALSRVHRDRTLIRSGEQLVLCYEGFDFSVDRIGIVHM